MELEGARRKHLGTTGLYVCDKTVLALEFLGSTARVTTAWEYKIFRNEA